MLPTPFRGYLSHFLSRTGFGTPRRVLSLFLSQGTGTARLVPFFVPFAIRDRDKSVLSLSLFLSLFFQSVNIASFYLKFAMFF